MKNGEYELTSETSVESDNVRWSVGARLKLAKDFAATASRQRIQQVPINAVAYEANRTVSQEEVRSANVVAAETRQSGLVSVQSFGIEWTACCEQRGERERSVRQISGFRSSAPKWCSYSEVASRPVVKRPK
jgi:uncharacterized protein YcbK (DUF882 family)